MWKALVFLLILLIPLSSQAEFKKCDTKIIDVSVDSAGELTAYFADIRHSIPGVKYSQPLALNACNIIKNPYCKSWQALLMAALLAQKTIRVKIYNSQRIPSCGDIPEGSRIYRLWLLSW